MIEIEWPDTWIFLSIARSDGAEFRSFFAAADHINCSLPTDEEIENGINKLSSCDLVEASDDSFSLTDKGRKLFEKGGGYDAYPRKQSKVVEPLLKKAAKASDLSTTWHIDAKRMATSLDEYSAIVRDQIKKTE